jgi:hypothetical protein
MVIAKLCDLQPAPVVDEVVAPGRPPLDDRDGRPAGLRRHAALAVAADAGDVGLGRAGGGGHGGMLSPSAQASVQARRHLGAGQRAWRLGRAPAFCRFVRLVSAWGRLAPGARWLLWLESGPGMDSWERLSRRAARPGGLPVSACSLRGAPAGRRGGHLALIARRRWGQMSQVAPPLVRVGRLGRPRRLSRPAA